MLNIIIESTLLSLDVHLVCRNGNKISYMVHNLGTGKVEQDSTFPTNTQSFIGLNQRLIRLDNAGQNTPVLLRDGNGALYPLAKDSVGGIKDPLWPGLPPLKSLSIGLQSLNNLTSNTKTKVVVIGFGLQMQTLIPHLLRCDLEKVKTILAAIEEETSELDDCFCYFKSCLIDYLVKDNKVCTSEIVNRATVFVECLL